MSERKAWLYLAELWRHTVDDNVGDVRVVDGANSAWGLCHSIGRLCRRGEISKRTARSMEGKIPSGRRFLNNYAWPLTKNGARSRVRFCVQQARLFERKKRKAPKSKPTKRRST